MKYEELVAVGFLFVAIIFASLWVRELMWRKTRWLECHCVHQKERGRYEWECPFHGHVDENRYKLYQEGRIGP